MNRKADPRSRLLSLVLSLCLLAPLLCAAVPARGEEAGENGAEGQLLEEPRWLFEFGLATVEEDEGGQPVKVNGYPVRKTRGCFNNRANDSIDYYDTWFAEYPFWGPATAYEPNLASMSLSLALSADRPMMPNEVEEAMLEPSGGIEQYMAGAGFSDIRKDDYDKVPTQYTVSSAIGSRLMEQEGEEPFTLLAVAVCGSYYKNEWVSNFNVGNGEFHQGFRDAAGLIVDRVAGYIATHGITGRVKVWMSGFSRSAAISNIAGGLMTASGMIPREDLFVYTFATPAGVLHPPTEGYENIFNILGASDPVPQVAPPEWGFGRYGRDIILPAVENASYLGTLFADMRESSAEGKFSTRNMYNPAMNLRLRVLYAMILGMVKSRQDYYLYYQMTMQGLLEDKSTSNMLRSARLLLLLTTLDVKNSHQTLDRMANYAFRVMTSGVFRQEYASYDSNSGNLMFRLANEHTEDSYLASMTLLRMGILYNQDQFCYVAVRGDVSLTVNNLDMPGDVFSLSSQGERISSSADNEAGDALDDLRYAERIGNASIVAIPMDCNYEVTWRAESDGEVDGLWMLCGATMTSVSSGATAGRRTVKAGDTGVAFRMENREPTLTEGYERTEIRMADMAAWLGIDSLGLNWRVLVTLIVLLVTLILFVLLAIPLLRLLGKGRRGFLFWLALAVMCVASAEAEAAFWFLADMSFLRTVWKVLLGLGTVALFLLRHRESLRDALPALAVVVLAVVADVLINISLSWGEWPLLAFYLLLAVLFLKKKRMTGGQWVIWAGFSLTVAGAIVYYYNELLDIHFCIVAVIATVMILVQIAASALSGRVRFTVLLHFLGMALLAFYNGMYAEPLLHIASECFVCLSLILLALYRPGEGTAGAEQEPAKPLQKEESITVKKEEGAF